MESEHTWLNFPDFNSTDLGKLSICNSGGQYFKHIYLIDLEFVQPKEGLCDICSEKTTLLHYNSSGDFASLWSSDGLYLVFLCTGKYLSLSLHTDEVIPDIYGFLKYQWTGEHLYERTFLGTIARWVTGYSPKQIPTVLLNTATVSALSIKSLLVYNPPEVKAPKRLSIDGDSIEDLSTNENEYIAAKYKPPCSNDPDLEKESAVKVNATFCAGAQVIDNLLTVSDKESDYVCDEKAYAELDTDPSIQNITLSDSSDMSILSNSELNEPFLKTNQPSLKHRKSSLLKKSFRRNRKSYNILHPRLSNGIQELLSWDCSCYVLKKSLGLESAQPRVLHQTTSGTKPSMCSLKELEEKARQQYKLRYKALQEAVPILQNPLTNTSVKSLAELKEYCTNAYKEIEDKKEADRLARGRSAKAGTEYYDILGVNPTASDNEIKKAYREAARNNHPDKVKLEKRVEANVEMQKIVQAYTVLSDPAQRKRYDMGTLSDQHIQFGAVCSKAFTCFFAEGQISNFAGKWYLARLISEVIEAACGASCNDETDNCSDDSECSEPIDGISKPKVKQEKKKSTVEQPKPYQSKSDFSEPKVKGDSKVSQRVESTNSDNQGTTYSNINKLDDKIGILDEENANTQLFIPTASENPIDLALKRLMTHLTGMYNTDEEQREAIVESTLNQLNCAEYLINLFNDLKELPPQKREANLLKWATEMATSLAEHNECRELLSIIGRVYKRSVEKWLLASRPRVLNMWGITWLKEWWNLAVDSVSSTGSSVGNSFKSAMLYSTMIRRVVGSMRTLNSKSNEDDESSEDTIKEISIIVYTLLKFKVVRDTEATVKKAVEFVLMDPSASWVERYERNRYLAIIGEAFSKVAVPVTLDVDFADIKERGLSAIATATGME